MKRKSKIILAAIISMSFGAFAYGTHAYFSSSASSDTASITAKTLKIEKTGESKSSTFNDAEPGDEEKGKGALVFKIKNSGQMNARMTYSINADVDGMDGKKLSSDMYLAKPNFTVSNVSRDQCTTSNINSSSYMTMSELSNWIDKNVNGLVLNSDGNILLNLDLMLSKDADNSYQGSVFNISVNAIANQIYKQ